MIADPKAISHGDGAATGALTAFTGMSAANAGAAAVTASAATTDNKTFFIEPAPFRFDRLPADTFRPSPLRTEPYEAGCDRPVRNRTCIRPKFTHVTLRRGKPKTV